MYGPKWESWKNIGTKKTFLPFYFIFFIKYKPCKFVFTVARVFDIRYTYIYIYIYILLTTISKFTKLPLKQTKKKSPLIYLFEQARYQKMFVNLVEHVTGIYLDKKEEKKKSNFIIHVFYYISLLKKCFTLCSNKLEKKSDTYHIWIIHEV